MDLNQVMRIFIYFLVSILATTFCVAQNTKVSIDQNIGKYEIKDEYNRFDDIGNPKSNFESLNLDLISPSELEISNKYSSGFTGNTITFRLTNQMKLKNVTYNYWTDVADFENVRTYKVKTADLKLNQNPFAKTIEFRGNYALEIEHYVNDSLIRNETFKGKFKTFEGQDKESENYKWTVEQNNIWYGITNENGVYLNPDIRPKLRSSFKDVVIKIKELSNLKIPYVRVWLVIKEDGRIDKESIGFSNIYNDKLKNSIANILVEKMEFYPACVNEKAVISKIPMSIKLE